MGATNVSHGVITIDVKDLRSPKVAENLAVAAIGSSTNHPITTGVAAEPVVQYPVTAPVAAEVSPQAEPEQGAAQPAA